MVLSAYCIIYCNCFDPNGLIDTILSTKNYKFVYYRSIFDT